MTTLLARSAITSSVLAISERTHLVSEAVELIFAPVLPQEFLHLFGSFGSVALMTIVGVFVWHMIGPLLRSLIVSFQLLERVYLRINFMIERVELALRRWARGLLRKALLATARRSRSFARRFQEIRSK